MALTPQDVSRIAHLARLELSGAEQASLLTQLNGFFSIVEQRSAVDTTGVEPDIFVDNDPAREYAGEDQQLDRAIQVILDLLKKNPVKLAPPPPLPVKR